MTESSKINTAIASAMGQVQKLSKDDRNAHGNYSFASIDKFLDACRPILAAHGLHPNIDGVASDTFMAGTNKLWGKFSYRISMHHQSGESTEPSGMDVMLPLTGAQTSGSAQSYALKQYLRGLLMISTGEKDDPDFHQPAPKDGVDGVAPEVKPKTPEELEAEIKSKKTLVSLHQWNQDNAAEITRLQNEDLDTFNRLYSVWEEKQEEIQNGST
jgi:hypothetical protein